jgi:hypothetical protein
MLFTMKKIKSAFIITILIALFSCSKDVPIPGTTNAALTYTSVKGIVIDEANLPVFNATVSSGTGTVSTDSLGFFSLDNISVSADRIYVKVNKTGFFTGSKAFIPVPNGISKVKIMLSSNTPTHTIDAATGGSANLGTGAIVNLPSNAVSTPEGTPYTGTIQLAVMHLDPTSDNFDNLMPGDLEAIRADGTGASLFSYGMLNVELSDNSGNPLKITDGKSASLTFPVPASMQGSAPANIPLWYFDEVNGIWKEEGTAVLVGNNYVGQVNHFSTWNCDVPQSRATITGKVKDCNGLPLGGVTVITGQRQVITNMDGIYTGYVATETVMNIFIQPSDNFGMTAGALTVGPFSGEETFTAPDLVATCPAYINGKILNCDSSAALPSFVMVSWPGGANFENTANDGSFKIAVQDNQSVNINAFGSDGSIANEKSVLSPSQGNTTNAGNIISCEPTNPISYCSFVVNGGIYNNTVFTMYDKSGDSGVYHTLNNITNIHSFTGGVFPDHNSIDLSFIGNSTGNYSFAGGLVSGYLHFDNINGDSITNFNVTITRYDPAGGSIEGTFYASFSTYQGSYTITNGIFSVRRKEDNTQY